MKKTLCGMIVLSIFSTFAATIETTNVDSFLYRSENRADKCIYDSGIVNYPRGGSVFKVFLNSDDDANINFALELDPSQIPLKDGEIKSPYRDVKINYADGVLTYIVTEKDGFIEKTTLSIRVDRNLEAPEEALGEERFTGPTRSPPYFVTNKLIKMLHCKF